MSVLPHGAEPITRQADLLLILCALAMSQDFFCWSWLRFQDRMLCPPPIPFLFSLPLSLSSCYCKQVLPPVLLWTALAIVCPTSDHHIYAVQWDRSICSWVKGDGEETLWGNLICECLQNNLFKLYLIVFFLLAVQVGWLLIFGFFSCLGQKDLDDD